MRKVILLVLVLFVFGNIEAQSFVFYRESPTGGSSSEFFNVFLSAGNDLKQLADVTYILKSSKQNYSFATNPFSFLEYKNSIIIFWNDKVVAEGVLEKNGWNKFIGDLVERSEKGEIVVHNCCSIFNDFEYIAYISYLDYKNHCNRGLAVKIDKTNDKVLKRIEFSSESSSEYREMLNGKAVSIENKYIFIDAFNPQAYDNDPASNDAMKLFSVSLIDLDLNITKYNYSASISDLINKGHYFFVFPCILKYESARQLGFLLAYSIPSEKGKTYKLKQYEYNEKQGSFNPIINSNIMNKKYEFHEIGSIDTIDVLPFLRLQDLDSWKLRFSSSQNSFWLNTELHSAYVWPRYEVTNIPLLLTGVSKLDSGYIDVTEPQKDLFWFPMDSKWIGAKTAYEKNLRFNSYSDWKVVLDGNYFFFLYRNTKDYSVFKDLLFYSSPIQVDLVTGYKYFEVVHAKSKIKSRVYLLYGKDILVVVESTMNNGTEVLSWGFDQFEKTYSMDEMTKRRKMCLIGDGYVEYEYLDSGIHAIGSSSYLVETIGQQKLDYRADYLKNRICKLPEGVDVSLPIFDNFMRCWAEGVPGDGIGEWLEVEFSRQSDEIMILNGYVDFRNMGAYKKNGRLKKIRVVSDSPKFSFDYTLPDYVAYHSVPLPQKTSKVKITILEVYKGTKYDDTCVTAIALPQKRTRSIEEEKRELLQYLKEIKVLEYLDQFKKEQE